MIEESNSKELNMVTFKQAINSNDIQWAVDVNTAKEVIKKYSKSFSKGSWEYFNIIRPLRTQLRQKKEEIYLYSSGFSNVTVKKILNLEI